MTTFIKRLALACMACWMIAGLSAEAFQTTANASGRSGNAYDVVIVGAGTGGFSAAIQAARMGMRVALLEETDWVGGQMAAAGVSTMDEGTHLTPPSGLYKEMLDRLDAAYAAKHKPVGTCYWQTVTHCYEPSAIRKTLMEMIADTNAGSSGHIDVALREGVTAVHEQKGAVTGVRTSRGRELASKVLIDATEYGDVLPLTSVKVRAGNSFARSGKVSCTQSITYTMVLKKYPKGVPEELQMKTPPPGYERWRSALVYEMQPDGNPKSRKLPVGFAMHNAYRGLPDSSNPAAYDSSQPTEITKTTLNWFNDHPVDTRIFDRAERRKMTCEAKLSSLANLYYIQHEMGEKDWSIANDEGYDTAYNREENECREIPQEFKVIEHNMAQEAYVRESQRMVGVTTLRAGEIRRDQNNGLSIANFPEAIAVGDYADDLHGCNKDADMEKDIERLTDIPPGFRVGPFQVPMQVLIPEHLDGFLAAEKNISQGRIANGATRLQPITMLTGQADGVLAALSIRERVTPRTITVEQVQMELLKAGSILARERMSDVPLGSEYWVPVQFAIVHEWVPGPKGEFGVNTSLTRAQAAQMLVRAYNVLGAPDYFDQKPAVTKSSFRDLPLYHPASSSVELLKEKGAMSGCTADGETFCPDDPISKKDLLLAISKLSGTDVPSQEGMRSPVTKGEAIRMIFQNIQQMVTSAGGNVAQR